MSFRIGPSEDEKTATTYEHQSWPAWFFHPVSGEGKIFKTAAEVPEGWVDAPGSTRTVEQHGLPEHRPSPTVANSNYRYQPWPAWFYHPVTGEGQIFANASEVPEGWVDTPGGTPGADANSLAAAEEPATAATAGGSSGNGPSEPQPATVTLPDKEDRAGIVAMLKLLDVRFNNNWKTERMYDTLVDAVKPKE